MRTAFHRLCRDAVAVALAAIAWLPSAQAILPPAHAPLPNYDKRGAAGVQPRAAASQQVQTAIPNAQVDLDAITGAPKWVRSTSGFLTGPDGAGGGVSPLALAALPGSDSNRVVKAFLNQHAALFGHDANALAAARVKRDFVTPHNGLRTVVWEQQLDGIPVFEGLLVAHLTKADELVSISSGFLSDHEGAAGRGTPNHALLQASPAIAAAHAVALAARELGETTETAEVSTVEPQPAGATKRQQFRAPQLNGEAEAQLAWLPMSGSAMRLCWEVILTSHTRGEMFRVLVDAETGEALVRHCLTEYISNASYRVFTSDSPSPFSPGHSTPNSGQPPVISRSLVTWGALNTTASPNGWIDDGVNETRGNNADAHTDHSGYNQPDLPRPQGSPTRVFDFAQDLTQAPASYANAAVVQLFYWNNWMHDRLYELGFTEAAGNFQNTNFGRGGSGNDAVQADAQDGGGNNNANFSTPPDGSAPRMQMYIFTGPIPDRDGDLDAEVILHEYTHGLSNRRVGGGVGIHALQTGGMGEGWSDFYGLSLLSEAGDDVHGVYAAGGYLTYLWGGMTQNYYYGIRRYPYCTDTNKNPLTFKDIDRNQASAHSGVPRSPVVQSDASEVHNMGEVWCVTLWEARANLIDKQGWAAGNQLILQLVTDGMNLSPANPNFLQARDAILQADLVDNGGANLGELWAAFAKRGMGVGATSPSSSSTIGLKESYVRPGEVSGFAWSPISSPQIVNAPFTVTLTAVDGLGNPATNFNGTVALNCTATSTPPTVLISPIVSGSFSNGQWTGSVTVQQSARGAVLRADDGNGHAGLSNPFNTVATNMPPVVLVQPATQTVILGLTAAFSVEVDGTPPFSYQWSFNGTNLDGATNQTLTVPNAQFANAGVYAVAVTNLFGATTSSNATLAVFLVPVITSFSPLSAAVGATVNINGTGFDPLPGNNTVYFGPVRAVVTGASTTNLAVTVPAGAAYAPITATVNGLTAYSSTPFSPTFAGNYSINSSAFAPQTPFTAPAIQAGTAVADIDGDGKPDLISANYTGDSVSIFRNTSTNGGIGANSFATPITIAVGSVAHHVMVGDLDGDCRLDLVVVNQNSGTVSVLRNTSTPGAISFTPKFDLTAGSDSRCVLIRDLDGDGKPDIAVSSLGSSCVSVYRNLGTPGNLSAQSFAARVDFATGNNAATVTVGDLNGDGKPDLVTGNGSKVCILRNTSVAGVIATNSFAPRLDVAVGTPWGVAVGDLDGDGKADLALANQNNNTVTVLRNTTTNVAGITFAAGVNFATGSYAYQLAIGDLNGDGKPDLVVTCAGASSVSVFQNTSVPGTFDSSSLASQVTFATGGGPRDLTLADLDGDGRLDVTVANLNSSYVSVLWNAMGPKPPPPPEPPYIALQPADQIVAVGATASFAVAAGGTAPLYYQWGFNGTNLTEATNAALMLTNVQLAQAGSYVVLVTNACGSVLSSNATLTVYSPAAGMPVITSFSPISASAGATVNLNGTGFAPLASNNIVYFGPVRAVITSANTTNLVVAVPPGAAYAPITVTVNGLTAYSSAPFSPTFAGGYIINTSAFAPQTTFTAPAVQAGTAVADIDGDGKPDPITANYNGNSISVFRNTSTNEGIGNSSFAAPFSVAVGSMAHHVTVGDLDGDGRLDLAVANQGSSTVSVLRNTSTPGAVSLAPKFDLTTGSDCRSVLVCDWDGDGKPDIAAPGLNSAFVSIFRNIGTPGDLSVQSFAARVDFATAGSPLTVTTGDLNGDGKPDLVTGNGNKICILRNTSTPGVINSNSFAPRLDVVVGAPWGVAVGDLDGDGMADLAIANQNNNTVTVLRNTTTNVPGITFAAGVNFVTESYAYQAAIGDLTGDGKPDLVITCAGASSISVFQNTSVPGIIDSNSLASRVTFATGGGPRDLTLADLDGDGRLDVAVANLNSSYVSVLRNTVGSSAPPLIISQPAGQIAALGGAATFTVNARSVSPVRFQWWKDSTEVIGGTNSTLTLTNLLLADFGNYRVVVANAYGWLTSSNALLFLDNQPVAGPDVIQRYAPGGVRVRVADLLSNDTDYDGDPLVLTDVIPISTAGGIVSLDNDWVYYAPPAGWTNADTFAYTVSDGHSGGTALGVVTVQIKPDTSAPADSMIERMADGAFRVTIYGLPGSTCRIQYAESLLAPIWNDLATEPVDVYGVCEYTDCPPLDAPARFYRSIWP